MSIEIRRMSVEDLPAVYRLGLRCYDPLEKPYNYWSVREVAEHLELHPEVCHVAVADKGMVVGFALGDESFELIKDTGHLEWIAVAPEYRRKGVASKLISAMVGEFQRLGLRSVVADISSKNPASVATFRKAGFDEGITVTFFVRDLGRE